MCSFSMSERVCAASLQECVSASLGKQLKAYREFRQWSDCHECNRWPGGLHRAYMSLLEDFPGSALEPKPPHDISASSWCKTCRISELNQPRQPKPPECQSKRFPNEQSYHASPNMRDGYLEKPEVPPNPESTFYRKDFACSLNMNSLLTVC